MQHSNIIFSRPEPGVMSVYEKISICIIFMSDTIITTGKYSVAGTADWLALPAGAFMSVPFIIAASFIMRRCRNSLFINICAALFSAAAVMLTLYVFSDFVKTCVVPEINMMLIPAGILITAFYSAFRTTDTLCRAVHMIMPVIIIFSLCALIIASTRFRTDNITDSAFLPPAAASASSAVFAAVFTVKAMLMLCIFSSGKSTRSDCAAVCAGTLIYAAVMSAMLFTSLGVLGAGLYRRLDYPLYYPLGLTGIGDYFERTEIISVVMFMVILVFKTGIFIRTIIASCSRVRKQVHL